VKGIEPVFDLLDVMSEMITNVFVIEGDFDSSSLIGRRLSKQHETSFAIGVNNWINVEGVISGGGGKDESVAAVLFTGRGEAEILVNQGESGGFNAKSISEFTRAAIPRRPHRIGSDFVSELDFVI
jgi:hypothetical protein